MAIRLINYSPKITAAKTQYVTIDPIDMGWVQTELIHYLSLMGELDGHRNADIRQVQKIWWYKRTATLPKGNNGQNSPLTFVSGIINNISFGSQRDLSTVQMDAIENISAVMSIFEDSIKDLNLTTVNGTAIKFQQQIFQVVTSP